MPGYRKDVAKAAAVLSGWCAVVGGVTAVIVDTLVHRHRKA